VALYWGGSKNMTNKTKQTTDKGQEVIIDHTIINGCGAVLKEHGLTFKCGNLINGFLYLCAVCDKKVGR